MAQTIDEIQNSLLDIVTLLKARFTCYILSSWMLSSKTVLKISDFCEIRYFSAKEAKKLGTRVRQENTYAHHYRGVHFYTQRARELGDHTVIEVFLPGEPKNISDEADQIASNLEKIVVLSSTIALNKNDLQRRLGIGSRLRTDFDFVFRPDFYHISSKSRHAPVCNGIVIDDRFCNRFFRCGFNVLVDYISSKSDVATRVNQSIDWLFDSRIEPRLHASIVKSSIALESLLIFNESESLANSLSERAAFILD